MYRMRRSRNTKMTRERINAPRSGLRRMDGDVMRLDTFSEVE